MCTNYESIESIINYRKSTDSNKRCFTCEYWYNPYYDAECNNEQIREIENELYQKYGDIDDWSYNTSSNDVCDLYMEEISFPFITDKTFKLREWVKIIKGEYKGKIGEIIPSSSGVEGRVQIGDFTTDFLTYDYIEKITDPDNVVPFMDIKIPITKNEYNKLIKDHDKYCDIGDCESCYCNLGKSINPRFDELCLYNFIKKV